jgi:hypothetical protein
MSLVGGQVQDQNIYYHLAWALRNMILLALSNQHTRLGINGRTSVSFINFLNIINNLIIIQL